MRGSQTPAPPLPFSTYKGDDDIPELKRRAYGRRGREKREGKERGSHYPPTIPRGFLMSCYCSMLMKLDIKKRTWSGAKQLGN